MAEKYFKRYEAEELLPTIGDWLEKARKQKQRIEGLDLELSRAVAQIMALGGSIPPAAELTKKKAERELSMARLDEAINKIQETGCLVKDLDLGLVDFPSLLEGREIYLCWKLGEERIGFWHGIEEGFAGRKPLDDPSLDAPSPGSPRIH